MNTGGVEYVIIYDVQSLQGLEGGVEGGGEGDGDGVEGVGRGVGR